MKFNQLSKTNQKVLIELLNMRIGEIGKGEGVEEYQNPSLEEYEQFYNEYNDNYEIDDNGYPQSCIEAGFKNKHSIEFEGRKVKLRVVHYQNNEEREFYL